MQKNNCKSLNILQFTTSSFLSSEIDGVCFLFDGVVDGVCFLFDGNEYITLNESEMILISVKKHLKRYCMLIEKPVLKKLVSTYFR